MWSVSGIKINAYSCDSKLNNNVNKGDVIQKMFLQRGQVLLELV